MIYPFECKSKEQQGEIRKPSQFYVSLFLLCMVVFGIPNKYCYFCSIKKKKKDQCKEIEENNRMGKTRDLFKKIKDTKGTFHAKMGT